MKIKIADIALIVCLICISFVPLFLFGSADGQTAVVTVDGQIVYELPLDKDASVTIDGICSVVVQDGRVCVQHSSCKDHMCEKLGWIHTCGNAIVCLPSRLTVTVAGGGGVDAVAG